MADAGVPTDSARSVRSTSAELAGLRAHTHTHNEAYLRAHPELKALMDAFMSELLTARPDDVLSFAVRFFAQQADQR